VVRSVRVCDISEQNLVPSIPMQSSNLVISHVLPYVLKSTTD
jgi:hypothetical protein